MNVAIENEWLHFLENNNTNSANNSGNNSSNNNSSNNNSSKKITSKNNSPDNSADNSADNSIDNSADNSIDTNNCTSALTSINESTNISQKVIPEKNFQKNCSSIYISTKTKILFLSTSIDIFETFWILPITDYNEQKVGIVKKQIKLSFDVKEDYDKMLLKLDSISNLHNKIITHIDSNNRFKHVRKISIGLCKKDLLYARNKEKSAFYNCFVLSLRINIANSFKEMHIKIFNTGKIEIPGIQNDEQLNIIINNLLVILNKYVDPNITCNYKDTEDVLINSNFNCGFYINREILYSILRNKYNINAIYDPCSYPGIRCIYYCDNNATKISYMIFRTGSILIVGKCNEDTLNLVYEYIKNILSGEYENIFNEGSKLKEVHTKKMKKKFVYIE
jgi:TATA-box binding protein (TBP) (component of TFIID and TFIIIB)